MPRTICLIDDDPDDLAIMQDAIEEVDKSIRSICFMNPEEALRAIADKTWPFRTWFSSTSIWRRSPETNA